MQSTASDYLPIVIMFVVALGFVIFVMLVSHNIGPKNISATKLEPFECGIEPEGNARVPVSIKYFLVAILFVLFDVEVIFMYPWAVNFKGLALAGLIEMFTFIGVFLIGFYYILKKGALTWEH